MGLLNISERLRRDKEVQMRVARSRLARARQFTRSQTVARHCMKQHDASSPHPAEVCATPMFRCCSAVAAARSIGSTEAVHILSCLQAIKTSGNVTTRGTARTSAGTQLDLRLLPVVITSKRFVCRWRIAPTRCLEIAVR